MENSLNDVLKKYGGRDVNVPAPETQEAPAKQEPEAQQQAPATKPEETATTTEVAQSEGSSLTKTENSGTEESTVDLYKITGGKIKSIEDIDAYETRIKDYEAKMSKQESERYANEFIAKLDALARSGKQIDANLLNEINIDYNSYDVSNPDQALQLVAKKMKMEDPSLTDRELQIELEDKFGRLNKPDEYASEDEKAAYERAVTKLAREARKVKPELEAFQKELTAPLQKQATQTQAQIEEQQRQLDLWKNTVKQEVSKFDRMNIKIEDEEFGFEIPAEDRAAVESTIINSDKFFNKFVNPDNTVDFSRLSKAMYFSDEANLQKFVNAAVAQALAKGSKKVVETLNNTNMTPNSTQTSQSNKPQMTDAIKKKLNLYMGNRLQL